MRLVWTTDPHLNHTEASVWRAWLQSIASHGADGVVITGDISEGDDVVFQLERLAQSLSVPIYFVLGNHDFYHRSIAATRQAVIHAARESSSLHYLTDAGVIPLADDASVVLVGEDGWGDASEGNYEGSLVRLNDFRLIDDFRLQHPGSWKQQLIELGAEASSRLLAKLESVPPSAHQVIIATHVPPYCEACWYEGKTTDENWSPFFVCGQLGKVILSHCRRHADRHFMVLCGHTHHDGIARMAENLVVYTGAATYGKPGVEAVLDCSKDQVTVRIQRPRPEAETNR